MSSTISETRLLETRHGPCEAFHGDLIGNALELYGEWAWLEVEFVAALVKNLISSDSLVAPAFYDLGAYVGTFGLGLQASLDAAGLGKCLSGLAVEASPVHAEVLRRNVARRGHDVRLRVVSQLVGFDGTRRTGLTAPGNWGGTRFVSDDSARCAGTSAPSQRCVSLRLLRDTYGPYGILKLDLEGMEAEAIQSDLGWIRDKKPLIYSECNEAPEALELFKLLLGIGYDVYYFAFPAFNIENLRGATRDTLFNGAYESALVGTFGGIQEAGEFRLRGCLVRRLYAVTDLVDALWTTPRWTPPRYRELSMVELRGVVGKLSQGSTVKEFGKSLVRGE